MNKPLTKDEAFALSLADVEAMLLRLNRAPSVYRGCQVVYTQDGVQWSTPANTWRYAATADDAMDAIDEWMDEQEREAAADSAPDDRTDARGRFSNNRIHGVW